MHPIFAVALEPFTPPSRAPGEILPRREASEYKPSASLPKQMRTFAIRIEMAGKETLEFNLLARSTSLAINMAMDLISAGKDELPADGVVISAKVMP